MHTGHVISGAGHLTLIGWMVFGGVFRSEPPPFEVTEVSMISGAQFDAMMAAQQSPNSATQVAQPQAPDVAQDTPEVAATPDEAVEQPVPQPAEIPDTETPPDVTELAPLPQAEVTDTPPELDQPVGDIAVQVPEVAPQAVPRPVERVAPQPVAQPDPDATPDAVEQAAVAPDETGETTEEPQEATAPEEATTEIVTEATAAPKASARPPGRRPAAPAPQQAAQAPSEAPSETSQDANAAAIAAAIADAQSEAETPAAAPAGPPLSAGEKEGLRVAVGECWNYGALSSDAQRTIVVVSVQMDRDGRPVIPSIRLVSSSGGSDTAARNGFQTARRAIIKCGSRGYPLPADKYERWKEVEITFNPEKMRRK